MQTDDDVLELNAELLTELDTEIELELFAELELGATLEEVFVELEELITDELLDNKVEQTAPVTTGFSAVPSLVFPCTPKLTDWPGCMVLFQSKAVAL